MTDADSEGELLSKGSFLFGLVAILASAYSQYIIGEYDLVLGTVIVYGLPLVIVSLLWGSTITRRIFNHMRTSVKVGVSAFGVFTLLGTLLATATLFIIVALDPSAVDLLQRPNPVLHISPELAWMMVGFSVLITGPVEEYLYRGFVFGGLLSLFKDRHWLSLALLSSIIFAATHFYFVVVYGIASLVQFVNLVSFGMAMATTYYLSEGNLVVPAVIHGGYNAVGFFDVATSLNVSTHLRDATMALGIAVAVVFVIQKRRQQRAQKNNVDVSQT